MMTNTIKLLAAAAAIGLTLCGTLSEASARARHFYGWQGNLSHSYRPPAGQIYERAFRTGRTPEQRARQDFQTDGDIQ
jgi:hypothetical protein